MVSFFSFIVTLAFLAPAPLSVQISPEHQAIGVRLELNVPLPSVFTEALPSGGIVRVVYPLRVRSRRVFWWDGRIWRGELTSQASFDPITGRYRCELLLDELIVASREVDTMDDAVQWLKAPPSVRLVLRDFKKLDRLYLRTRAIFSTATTWLVFTNSDGTDWVTVPIAQTSGDGNDETPDNSPATESG